MPRAAIGYGVGRTFGANEGKRLSIFTFQGLTTVEFPEIIK
jgi:hypothetical protein